MTLLWLIEERGSLQIGNYRNGEWLQKWTLFECLFSTFESDTVPLVPTATTETVIPKGVSWQFNAIVIRNSLVTVSLLYSFCHSLRQLALSFMYHRPRQEDSPLYIHQYYCFKHRSSLFFLSYPSYGFLHNIHSSQSQSSFIFRYPFSIKFTFTFTSCSFLR